MSESREAEIARLERGCQRLRELVWDETSEKLMRAFQARLEVLRKEVSDETAS